MFWHLRLSWHCIVSVHLTKEAFYQAHTRTGDSNAYKRDCQGCEPKWVSFGFQVKKTPNASHYNVCEPLKRRMDWDLIPINLLKWIQFFPCISGETMCFKQGNNIIVPIIKSAVVQYVLLSDERDAISLIIRICA